MTKFYFAVYSSKVIDHFSKVFCAVWSFQLMQFVFFHWIFFSGKNVSNKECVMKQEKRKTSKTFWWHFLGTDAQIVFSVLLFCWNKIPWSSRKKYIIQIFPFIKTFPSLPIFKNLIQMLTPNFAVCEDMFRGAIFLK